jgi:hypothetical protein
MGEAPDAVSAELICLPILLPNRDSLILLEDGMALELINPGNRGTNLLHPKGASHLE